MRRAGCGSSSRFVSLIAATMLIAVAGAGCARPDVSAGNGLTVSAADVLVSDSTTPPEDSAAWRPVMLPDDWSRTRPDVGGDAWYRVQFDRSPSQVRLTAIYVPRVSMVGIPYLNGMRLAGGGRFDDPMSRLWYRPQLYWVPADQLRAGRNVFHYRLRTSPDRRGGLSAIYIGDPGALESRWRSQSLLQVTAMQITTGITLALGLLVLVAWAVLGRNSAYAYFGLAALCWTLHSALLLTVDIPLPTWTWDVLIAASLWLVAVAMMMFALRFAGLRYVWIERTAWAYAVLAPLLLALVPPSRMVAATNLLSIGLLAIGIYVFRLLIDVARRTRSIESILLIGAAVFVMGLGVHDWLNRQGVFRFDEPFHLHYGVPVLFLAVYWNLLGQVAAGRRAAHTLNLELETRVRYKAHELEQSYQRLRAAREAEALAGERERIMRDMHDGMGSQLIAARQLAHSGKLEAAELTALLDECIDDLRLMIDSLEPSEGDLVTVLGNLRYRVSERLSRQQVTLRWEVADLPPTGLASREVLQLLRVVQEAIANVIKHADATEIVVSAGLSPDGRELFLSIRDNGRGFSVAARHGAGRGLSNMQQRAAALKGRLRIESSGGGCIVTLILPLPGTAVVEGTVGKPRHGVAS
jgi:signal transduction histidine kinase